MTTRLRSWWLKIIKHQAAIGVFAIVLAVVIALIIAGYQFDWTGFSGYNKVTTTRIISGTNAGTVTRTEEFQPGKALWDWLGLLAVLAIPIVVGFGAAWFTQTQQLRDQEHEKLQRERDQEAARVQHDRDQQLAEQRAQTERDIAQDNQREAVLQAYIDEISELLLKEHLSELTGDGELEPEYEQVRNIARVRTLTTLPRLDGVRKASLLQFLYESKLIEKYISIISLSEARLNGANLSGVHLGGAGLDGVDLSGANLEGAYLEEDTLCFANLSKANLSGAALRRADLFKANLSGADLSGADLFKAELKGADLSNANLSGANLEEAYLEDATGITNEELEKQAKSLKDATMPDGSKHA